MNHATEQTGHLLKRLRAGDAQARDDLIAHARLRLRNLASRMLKDYPGVARWEETGDVSQNALIRLYRALSTERLESSRHFWNLAALEIRRELCDLARHYQGPEGQGAKHHTDPPGTAANDVLLQAQGEDDGEPSSLEEWTRFHEKIDDLPDDEREVFGLLYYDGLSQEVAAAELGISVRTLKRRWQSARLLLAEALSGKRSS